MARCGCGYTHGGKLVAPCQKHTRERAAAKAAKTRRRNAKATK